MATMCIKKLEELEMIRKTNGKEFAVITGALLTAAATTAAGIAYFLNEEKVNKAADRLAEKTSALTEKAFDKVKEVVDDFLTVAEEEPEPKTAFEDVTEAVVVDGEEAVETAVEVDEVEELLKTLEEKEISEE